MSATTSISEVNSAIEGLVDLSGVVEAISASAPSSPPAPVVPAKIRKTVPPIVIGAGTGTSTVENISTTAKTPSAPGAKPAGATAIQKGVAALAKAVENAIYAGGNVYGALAEFGETAKISGHKDRCEATLRVLAENPDAYIAAGVPANIKRRIVKLADKGIDPGDHSRSVSALTAGSVLVHYMAEVQKRFSENPENTSGYTRVIAKLVGPCRDARISLGKPVPEGWNGSPDVTDKLPTILAASHTTETAAQAKQAEQREAGKAQVQAQAPAPAPVSQVPAPQGSAGRVVASSTVPGAAPAPVSQVPAPAGHTIQPHVSQLQSIENICAGLTKQAPDAIRAGVELEVSKIVSACDAVRKLYSDLNTAPANPADDLLNLWSLNLNG